MEKRQFKAESKKLLDMMINSIYTHKEIFLRELISNASDAIDKLYYKGLSEGNTGMNRDDFAIRIQPDKQSGELRILDNGLGMNQDEMAENLGTIAKSGSFDFKTNQTEQNTDNDEAQNKNTQIDIIGQFGVGFYSAFMVSDQVTVRSREFGMEQTWQWQSSGADGFTLEETSQRPGEDMGDPKDHGTEIILHLKSDTEDEQYSQYTDEFILKNLVRRYSDYIRYPITMMVEKQKTKEVPEGEEKPETPEYETYQELETLNSMVPIWKKKKSEINQEELNEFYKAKFMDFADPLKVIRTSVEGVTTYDALLFIPSQAPFDYYTKEYEKGLQLYSSGVMIMEKCSDLLPDYYSFVKGIVDSPDLSLNISREMLQHDRQLKAIAKRLESKIHSELLEMQEKERDTYDQFFRTFGLQLKFGLYDKMGLYKEQLKDLVMFYSSTEKKLVTLQEYVNRMKPEQKYIFYASGKTVESIDKLPQAEMLKDKGFEILYLTDDVDEFALQALHEFDSKEFKSISADELELGDTDEKEDTKKQEEENKALLEHMKEHLGDKVTDVKLSQRLKSYPVCLTTKGPISLEMEKVLNQMPANQNIKAERILEINASHTVLTALSNAYQDNDMDKVDTYTDILYGQALLIEGMAPEDPVAFGNAICSLMK